MDSASNRSVEHLVRAAQSGSAEAAHRIADDLEEAALRIRNEIRRRHVEAVPLTEGLKEHFRRYASTGEVLEETIKRLSGPAMSIPDSTPIHGLGLSARTVNCLRNESLLVAGEVRRAPDQDLLRIPNFGRRSLQEVRALFGRAT